MLQIALVNVSDGRLEPELWSCLGTENLVGSDSDFLPRGYTPPTPRSPLSQIFPSEALVELIIARVALARAVV